jgi:hypothetical protein
MAASPAKTPAYGATNAGADNQEDDQSADYQAAEASQHV